MQNPSLRVPPFFAQIGPSASLFPLREFHPQFHQFGHPRRSLLHYLPHHLLPAKPRPRLQSVPNVQFIRILGRGHTRDAALRIVGVRFHRIFLGQQQDWGVPGRLEGKTQPSNAAPHHHNGKRQIATWSCPYHGYDFVPLEL